MGDSLRDALEELATRYEELMSDEAVEAADNAWREQGAMRAALEVAQPFTQPQMVASRERVAEVLRDAADIHPTWILPGWFGYAANALLAAGVFREPPTRDQIEEAVSAAWLDPQAGSGAVVASVLALIGGDAK